MSSSSSPSSPRLAPAEDPRKQKALDFARATEDYCQEVVRALAVVTPQGLNLNLQILIRNGRICVKPESVFHGPGFQGG